MTKTLVAGEEPERPRDYGFSVGFNTNNTFSNVSTSSLMRNLLHQVRSGNLYVNGSQVPSGYHNDQTIEGEVAEDPKPQKEIEE